MTLLVREATGRFDDRRIRCDEGSETRCTTGFEDEGRRTGAKECRQTVGAGKGKKRFSPGDTRRN